MRRPARHSTPLLCRATALALGLSLAFAAPAALAQNLVFGGMRANTKAPVELAADNLSVNQSTGRAELSGNVVIGQGEMRLSASRVVVVYAQGDRSKIDSLEAEGNVTLVNGADAAEAQRARYDIDAGIVKLTGNVLVTQGANVLSGEAMDLDLRSGTAAMRGRVRSVLQPGGN